MMRVATLSLFLAVVALPALAESGANLAEMEGSKTMPRVKKTADATRQAIAVLETVDPAAGVSTLKDGPIMAADGQR